MRRSLTLLFFIIQFSVFAQKTIPELWEQHVHDEAHILSQQTIDSVEQRLIVYEDSTSNQLAVLIISSLSGEVLEEYSLRVAEKWKLGQKDKDNGALLLIAVDDHKMRIEVGQGLEGVLTDAMSNRIIRNEMAPNFRRNNYDAGVTAGVEAMIKAIGGEYAASDNSNANDFNTMTGGARILIGLFIFGILGLFAAIALFSEGCMAWGLYLFLIPFYAAFPWMSVGFVGGILVFAAYLIGFPIAKVMINRSPKWKSKLLKWQSSGGGRWSSGSGWSSGGGGSRGGGFSGGGGSFGGGGSSGSW